jgi:hypothetical protein
VLVLAPWYSRAQEPVGPPLPPPKLPAGEIPANLVVRFTGPRTEKTVFMPLVMREVYRTAKARPGAKFNIDEQEITAPPVVARGQSGVVRIPFSFCGEGYTPVKSEVNVRVDNLVLQSFERSRRLYVSNNPESIARPGTLITGSVDRFESVRFLFHHKNISSRPLAVAFLVKNHGDEPTLIQLIEGSPQVSRREMAAGHRAAVQFTQNLKSGVGRVIELAPGAEQLIYNVRFDPGMIASGIFELRALAGPGVVFALKAHSVDNPGDGDGLDIGDTNGKRGHGEFPEPYVSLEDDFIVGGRWKFIAVGDRLMPNSSNPSRSLAGNYGVTYQIQVAVQNPHDHKEQVDVSLSPVSGPAGVAVFIDGRPVDIPYTRSHNMVRLGSYVMPPNSSRTVTVETIPESGSFYPVRIVFGSRRIQ